MKNKFFSFQYLTLLLAFVIALGSCSKKPSSDATGQGFNNPKWGGYEKRKYKGQETGPGLMFIEGGSFQMGSVENDLEYNHDAVERKVTVNSFYMDETEISNHIYGEFENWTYKAFGEDNVEYCHSTLPDTLCWRQKLGFNEPFVDYYYRHPAYREHPVVGIKWEQANNFSAWRTDRVNETILDREKVIKYDIVSDANADNNFNTRTYFAGQYEFSKPNKKSSPLRDYRQKKGKAQKRTKAGMKDGILLPDYRLPTEAEWEYAAQSNIGNTQFNNIEQKRVYGWDDYTIRMKEGKEENRGKVRANLMVGKGDLGGIAGVLNDGALITAPVVSYVANDYGLFHMQGNVSEWVLDIYRPLSFEDYEEFMPYRGNEYKTVQLDQYGVADEKDSLGRLKFRNVTEAENVNRRNYKKSNNIGFKDEEKYSDELMYEYGITSLVNNKAHVFKGGSWHDRIYWASPGTRRFLDDKQDLSTLGFRCCMVSLGSPVGNSKKKNKEIAPGMNTKRAKKKRYN